MAIATGMVIIDEQMIASEEITKSNKRLVKRRAGVYCARRCVIIVVPWIDRT